MIEGEYPSLAKRYISSLIDGGLLLAAMLISAAIFHSESDLAIKLRVSIILFLYFNYEPIMVSSFCTLGQKLTGIRVRKFKNPSERINIIQAYVRLLIKLFLGALSFFTMGFSNERRAIHDYAAQSIVLRADQTVPV